MMKTFRILQAGMAAILLLAGAACSSDDDEPDNDNDNTTTVLVSKQDFSNMVEGKIWHVTDPNETKTYRPDGTEYAPEEIEKSGGVVRQSYYFKDGTMTEFDFASFGPVPDESKRKSRRNYTYILNEKDGTVTYATQQGKDQGTLFKIESIEENKMTIREEELGLEEGSYTIKVLRPADNPDEWWEEYVALD